MQRTKTSRQLKQPILATEEKVKRDKETIKEYLQPDHSVSVPFGILDGLLNSVKITPGLKTELMNTIVSLIAGVVSKKWFALKEVKKETNSDDQLMENAIKKAMDNYTDKMSPTENEIFKKLLHQYLISK